MYKNTASGKSNLSKIAHSKYHGRDAAHRAGQAFARRTVIALVIEAIQNTLSSRKVRVAKSGALRSSQRQQLRAYKKLHFLTDTRFRRL